MASGRRIECSPAVTLSKRVPSQATLPLLTLLSAAYPRCAYLLPQCCPPFLSVRPSLLSVRQSYMNPATESVLLRVVEKALLQDQQSKVRGTQRRRLTRFCPILGMRSSGDAANCGDAADSRGWLPAGTPALHVDASQRCACPSTHSIRSLPVSARGCLLVMAVVPSRLHRHCAVSRSSAAAPRQRGDGPARNAARRQTRGPRPRVPVRGAKTADAVGGVLASLLRGFSSLLPA
jgi:hypothetical protein